MVHTHSSSTMDDSDSENVQQDLNPASATFYVSISEGDIHELPYQENTTHLSVTSILHYCKLKIIRPYLRLLSVMGLRSLSVDHCEGYSFWDVLGTIYALLVVSLMIAGYVLQYMACYRRDRGFCYKIITSEASWWNVDVDLDQLHYEQICHGSAIFSYIIPSMLHLCAYLYAVIVFRYSEQDQLPSLMERVFLASSHIGDGYVIQKKLVRILWIFVGLCLVWMLLSVIIIAFMMGEGPINFKWLENKSDATILPLKILLVAGTLCHDLIQASVISSYCLQAQLLTSYLHFLRAKLLQYPIHSIDWMREISEFKHLLQYLNKDLATPACFFTFINLSWTLSGIVWLLGFDHVDRETLPIKVISVLNVGLWLTLTLAPFLQAARLTGACTLVQSVGHEVRARPFVHRGTPGSELDSLLLYASSLEMSAKLFKIPITGRCLATGITIWAVTVLVIGQCHYLNS